MNDRRQYTKRLASLRIARQSSLLGADILQLLGWLLLALLLFALLDRTLSLSKFFIRAYRLTVILLAVLYFTIRAVLLKRITPARMAKLIDRCRVQNRAHCQSAYELLRQPVQNDFQAFLIDRQTALAVAQLRSTPIKNVLPRKLLKRGLQYTLGGLALFGAALFLWHLPLVTALQRLADPEADIPPFSRYEFSLSPARPTVVYGGDLELATTINGAPVRHPVQLFTSDGQHQYSTPCFQDGTNRFVQQLNRLTEPVSFFFRTGRARSRQWPIELLLRPLIKSATVTLEAPTYSRKPTRSFALGANTVRGLSGSTVRLDIESNRPVLDGELRLVSPAGATSIVNGIKSDLHTVSFEWPLKQAATATASIRDIRETICNNPLQFAQAIEPDEKPEAVLLSPAALVLATPESMVPLEGYVSDDLGLREVLLLRACDDFRDRATTLAQDINKREYTWTSEMDLAQIGVIPGQTIDCYIEARDSNPALNGIAMSSIGQIQIISKEEYAENIRVQTTTQEFIARFNTTENAMREVIEALKKLQQSSQRNGAKRREQVMQAIDRAIQLYEHLEKDYAVYDEEKKLNAAMRTALKKLKEARSFIQLAEAKNDAGPLKMAATWALETLQPSQAQLEELRMQAEDLAQTAQLLECAARFRRMVGLQQDLVRRLNRFRESSPQQFLHTLELLGEQQNRILNEYTVLLENLSASARALPEEFSDLQQEALAFVQALHQRPVEQLMKKAHLSASLGKGPDAYDNAVKALNELLSQITKGKQNCIGGMCRQNFVIPDVNDTLQGMFRALCQRYGYGENRGGNGQGTGGASGYWMRGSSMAVPMIGPQRSTFSSSATSGVQGQKGSSGRVNAAPTSPRATETISTTTDQKPSGEGRSGGETPPKYRDAVRRYFSYEEAN